MANTNLQSVTTAKNNKDHTFDKQKGKCPICWLTFKIEEMEAGHM